MFFHYAQERSTRGLSASRAVFRKQDPRFGTIDFLTGVNSELLKDVCDNRAVLEISSRKEGEIISKEEVGQTRTSGPKFITNSLMDGLRRTLYTHNKNVR